MIWHKQIFRLQVDVSSYCNAKCAGCSRNISGGAKQPWLSLNHLDTETWRRLCEEDTKAWHIAELKLNGSWGDPGMHPNLPEMMDVFVRSHPEAGVRICTNGSTHTEQWWADLGRALSQNSGYHTVDFALDGLEDTHAIYRRSTDFNKIIRNARAFSEAGGYARWIMTLFDYNMHQLEDARDFARDNLFKEWTVRRSNLKNGRVETPTEDYFIYTDVSDGMDIPDAEWFFDEDSDISADIHRRINEGFTASACPWYSKGVVQIDPWGKVWPCCHVADASTGFNDLTQREEISKSLPAFDFNDLNKYTLTEVLSHAWYKSTLPDIVEAGAWSVCREECSVRENSEWINRNY